MKHPIWDRLLIVVCVLGLLCAAAGLGAVGAKAVSPAFFEGLVSTLQNGTWNRLLTFALAALVAVFALLLLAVVFPGGRRQKRSFAIQKNENGTVKISVKALEGLVAKCLTQHPELKIVSSQLSSDGDAVQVNVHVTLAADISIPLAVAALQKQIKQYLEACSGVDVREVRVIVDSTTDATEAGGSPYAIPARLQTSPAFARTSEPLPEPLPKIDVPPENRPALAVDVKDMDAEAAVEIAPETAEETHSDIKMPEEDKDMPCGEAEDGEGREDDEQQAE